MADPTDSSPAMCVVLHDVAPQTWPHYASFVASIDQLGAVPLTLLVVPDFHRQGALDRHPMFCRVIDERLARGDEVVLHGYHHDDPGPTGPNPANWLMRRIYTHEGEFYALGASEATARIERGLALFDRLSWPTRGFVPPAWLMSEGTRQALRQFDFTYTSDLSGLIHLPDCRHEAAPTLVWSARSPWRRSLSRLWNDAKLKQSAKAPLLRLGLHPIDMQHASSRRYWLRRLELLLDQRVAMTKSAWLA